MSAATKELDVLRSEALRRRMDIDRARCRNQEISDADWKAWKAAARSYAEAKGATLAAVEASIMRSSGRFTSREWHNPNCEASIPACGAKASLRAVMPSGEQIPVCVACVERQQPDLPAGIEFRQIAGVR